MAATSKEVLRLSLEAGADLSDKQFYFVKMSDDRKVAVCADVTDVPIGVLQNAPESGESADVMVIGLSKVSSDAALTAGDAIGSSSDGQAQTVTVGSETTVYLAGRVIDGTSAAGELASAVINCANAARAA